MCAGLTLAEAEDLESYTCPLCRGADGRAAAKAAKVKAERTAARILGGGDGGGGGGGGGGGVPGAWPPRRGKQKRWGRSYQRLDEAAREAQRRGEVLWRLLDSTREDAHAARRGSARTRPADGMGRDGSYWMGGGSRSQQIGRKSEPIANADGGAARAPKGLTGITGRPLVAAGRTGDGQPPVKRRRLGSGSQLLPPRRHARALPAMRSARPTAMGAASHRPGAGEADADADADAEEAADADAEEAADADADAEEDGAAPSAPSHGSGLPPFEGRQRADAPLALEEEEEPSAQAASCSVCSGGTRLLTCYGERTERGLRTRGTNWASTTHEDIIGMDGGAESGHDICESCLLRWFRARNELRAEAGLSRRFRPECPICKVTLRVSDARSAGDSRCLGLQKREGTWPDAEPQSRSYMAQADADGDSSAAAEGITEEGAAAEAIASAGDAADHAAADAADASPGQDDATAAREGRAEGEGGEQEVEVDIDEGAGKGEERWGEGAPSAPTTLAADADASPATASAPLQALAATAAATHAPAISAGAMRAAAAPDVPLDVPPDAPLDAPPPTDAGRKHGHAMALSALRGASSAPEAARTAVAVHSCESKAKGQRKTPALSDCPPPPPLPPQPSNPTPQRPPRPSLAAPSVLDPSKPSVFDASKPSEATAKPSEGAATKPPEVTAELSGAASVSRRSLRHSPGPGVAWGEAWAMPTELKCGHRVSITWAKSQASAEYTGTVVETTWVVGVRSRTVLAYKVHYDDGDIHWHHYGREVCRVLPTRPRPPTEGREPAAPGTDQGLARRRASHILT